MEFADLDFELPRMPGRAWHRAIDTALGAPDDAAVDAGSQPRVPEHSYHVSAHSVVVLIGRPAVEPAG
jgi:hypothetical protein